MTAQFIAHSQDDWENFKTWVWDKADFPIKIEYKAFSGMRSLNQNALFHMWMAEMEIHFINKGAEMGIGDGEYAKMLMKHKFLGYEDITIGRTEIKPQLKRTSNLDKGDMHHFMNQVDAWAVENGCFLTTPATSEYAKLREAQNQ